MRYDNGCYMNLSTNQGISGWNVMSLYRVWNMELWGVDVGIKHQLHVHKINILAQTIHMCTKRKINEEFITINHIHTSLKNPLNETSEEIP